MRVRFLQIILVLVLAYLASSLLRLQVFQADEFRELSSKNCIRLIPQSGSRGNIIDRKENPLAASKVSYDLVLLPEEARSLERTLTALAKILNSDHRELKNRFQANFVAQTMPVVLARNISLKKAVVLEEAKFELAGLMVQPTTLRYYPQGRTASHVLGYIGEIDRWRLTKLSDYGYKTRDMVGISGIEEKYDYYLRQEDGGLSVEVDHRGKFVRVVGFKPPQSGKDLKLTLDLGFQKTAEAALAGKKGSVVIITPESGEVIALASSPDFDPADFASRSFDSINRLSNNPDDPFLNRAISGLYPAGSLFKLVVACAGLELEKFNLYTSHTCSGAMEIGGREYNCLHVHGQQNLVQALAHSCNIFFYKSGLLAGAQLLHDYAVRFGLARLSGIELPYEKAGFIPDPLWRKIYKMQNWYNGDTANMAIGQGEVLVTPLQIARLMAVFANGGKLVTPYLVSAIGGKDVTLAHRKVAMLNIRPATLNSIRRGLREAVADPEGTARVLADLPLEVAGKTGTAQMPRGSSHGWFAGFFPYKAPRFVICVFLERAGSGSVAASLSRQIIASLAEQGLI